MTAVEEKTNGEINRATDLSDNKPEPIDSKPIMSEEDLSQLHSKPIMSEEDLSHLQSKIAKQIEYYFSDINLSRDKFLLEQISKDPDGWVEISTLLTFNRLKKMTTQKDTLVSALKHHGTGNIEVSEDDAKVRRTAGPPVISKEKRDEIQARSIYAKGFPIESQLDDIMAYFADRHGPYEQVFMRKRGTGDKKIFKGSVFVTFKNKEDADRFVQTESIKYDDTELVRYHKKAYLNKKSAELLEKKKSTVKPTEKPTTLKKGTEEKAHYSHDKTVESQMTKGAVLRLTGLSPSSDIRSIKNFFSDISKVAWVDLDQTKKEALVRFEKGEAQSVVDQVRKANAGKLEIDKAEIGATLLEGEDELTHWNKFFDELEAQRKQSKRGGKGRKRKFEKKGKPFSNKRKRFKDSDEEDDEVKDGDAGHTPVKVAKVENDEPGPSG